MIKALRTVGRYFMLMGRTFSRPERMRMFFRQYLNELEQLGVNSIGIVLLISFFIGAVITIQIKLNIESPWMPRWTVGYVTREIMLLEFSSSIMCLILAGKVGSNIASELGTMRVTQQIDALEIMGVNSANYLILPKIAAMVTVIPILVTFSIFAGIIGAFCTCWFAGVMNAVDLEYGLQYMFNEWFIWAAWMFCIFLYTHSLLKKQDEISKQETYASIGSFMICAYAVTIYVGTIGAGNELAVTIVSLFVFLPTNFDLLPIYNLHITIVALAMFFVSSYITKTPDKFMYDVMDGILAAVIGNFAAFERAKIKWESVKIHEQLEEERDIDMLTGIWNRRAFEREVDYLINSGTIKNMVVIMVDLDKFKRINDGYGHETGDAYLKHFCNLISEYTEKNTIVGRRSGDEFFIFSYNFRELSQVEHNVAAFYEKLAKNPILLPDGTERVIGVSSGVVWTVDMNHDWREILCAADESLYYVKEHGRKSYTIQEYIQK